MGKEVSLNFKVVLKALNLAKANLESAKDDGYMEDHELINKSLEEIAEETKKVQQLMEDKYLIDLLESQKEIIEDSFPAEEWVNTEYETIDRILAKMKGTK